MISTRKKRRGFTLVEMLVVIFIIGLLMSLLFPAIIAARESARAAQCINNQQELGKALIQYDMTKSRLPGVLSFANPPSTADPNPRKITWVMSIFGELGRMDLWKDWNQPDKSDGTQFPGTLVKVAQLICPSSSLVNQVGGLSYAVNLGVYNTSNANDFSGRLFRDRTATSPAEPDQTISSLKSPNRTVMLSENLQTVMWNDSNIISLSFQWPPASSTNKITDPPPGLGSNHRGMINVTFFDGHTEKIPETTACWNDPDNPLYGTP